jgi:hypothetical protein
MVLIFIFLHCSSHTAIASMELATFHKAISMENNSLRRTKRSRWLMSIYSALVLIIGFAANTPIANAQTWSGTTDGTAANWNQDSNWGAGPFPNAVGANASLTGNFTAAQAINLNVPITVGSLTFGDTTSNFFTPTAER